MQYQLLLDIASFPAGEELHMGDLAHSLQLTKHGILSLLDRCERMGLVERYTDQHAGKKILVRLRPQGTRLVDLLVRLHKEQLQSVQEVLASPACSERCTSPICWKGTD